MATSKTKAPEQTFQEVKYLKRLVDTRALIRVRLTSDEEMEGTLEFYDESFLRLTRDSEPNVFVFKHDIKYLWEVE